MQTGDADDVFAATLVMLEEPAKTALSWVGLARSTDIRSGLGAIEGVVIARVADGDGLAADTRDDALQSLPGQLAFGFAACCRSGRRARHPMVTLPLALRM